MWLVPVSTVWERGLTKEGMVPNPGMQRGGGHVQLDIEVRQA